MPLNADRSVGDETILVLAPIGRDAAAAASLLSGAGLHSAVCPTLGALGEALADGRGSAAVIAEEACAGGALDVLAGWVAAQPPWSDFPFILLTHKTVRRELGPHRLVVMQALHNVTLLERPVHGMTLVAAAQSA